MYEYIYEEDYFKKHLISGITYVDSRFTAIDIDKYGYLWIAGKGNNLIKYNPSNGISRFFEMDISEEYKSYKKVYVDTDGDIWIGMEWQGLSVFNPQEKSFFNFPTNEDGSGVNTPFVMDIKEVYPGKIFVATDQGGINIFDKETKLFSYINTKSANSGKLTSNGIVCFEKDSEDILWVGTSRGGVNYYNPHKQRFDNLLPMLPSVKKADKLSNGVIGTFLEHSDGNLWIGTDGGGINIYNRSSGDINIYNINNSGLSTDIIRSLSEDSKGNVWVATWGGGINKYIYKHKRFEHFDSISDIDIGYHSNNIWSANVDKKDRLWLNYIEGHVLVLDLKTGKEITRLVINPQYSHYYNHTVIFDDPNEIYIVNYNGVSKFNEANLSFELFINRSDIITFNPHCVVYS